MEGQLDAGHRNQKTRPTFVGMAIRSYSMPIASYFLVIGPALAACLWFVSSWLEPAPPPQARAAAPAQAKAGLVSPVLAASPTTAAAPQPDRTPFAPAKPADATRPAEPKSVQAMQWSPSSEATSRAAEVTKHKKRKQTAQQRRHRDDRSPAYAERSPYAAYASRYPYDPSPQPFFGFRGW